VSEVRWAAWDGEQQLPPLTSMDDKSGFSRRSNYAHLPSLVSVLDARRPSLAPTTSMGGMAWEEIPGANANYGHSLLPKGEANGVLDHISMHGTARDNGKKRRGNLPKHVTDFLRSWLEEHIQHPYPTEDEKHLLARHTGLTLNQVGVISCTSLMLDLQLVY